MSQDYSFDKAAVPYKALSSCLSVVILTLDEASNLPRCLDAIPNGIDTFLLDSGSTDRTIEIAIQYGAHISANEWQGFASQRNKALEICGIESEWVLFIDADEVFEKKFWVWAEQTLPHDPPYDVFFIDSRLVLDGELLRYAPAYPIYHARLVRHQPNVFVKGNVGHNETVRQDLRIDWLDIPYMHYWQTGSLLPWMHKHLNLAELDVTSVKEVEGFITKRSRWSRRFSASPTRAVGRFLYHYVWCSGYRDGAAGYKFACMYAWYEMSRWLLLIGR